MTITKFFTIGFYVLTLTLLGLCVAIGVHPPLYNDNEWFRQMFWYMVAADIFFSFASGNLQIGARKIKELFVGKSE